MALEAKKYLYTQIYEDLKSKISGGVFADGDFLPSEREIGESYNVDRTTVRKALTLLASDGIIQKKPGAGSQVVGQDSPETSLDRDTVKSIAFFLPKSTRRTHRISQPFYAALFYRLEEECRAHQHSLVYSVLDKDDDFSAVLDAGRYAGIVFVSNVARAFIDQAVSMRIPSVLINDYYPSVASIHTDNLYGMMLVCDHLIELGHRHFGFIAGASDHLTSRERMLACICSLGKAGLRIQDQYLEETNWEPGEGFEAARKILARTPRPTAIVAFNDNHAMECMQAISELGLRIPDDISVVGFDDLGQAQYTFPPLTTVHQHIRPMAKTAMQSLLTQIKNPEDLYNIRLTTPCSLVLRDTTAPPRKE